MNEFNNLNGFDVIDTNINNTIDNSIDNNITPEANNVEPVKPIETDNINDELNNIVMSYVNDESNIVESPVETFDFNPVVSNTEENVEEKIAEPTTDVIAPAPVELKPLFETNSEFTFATDLNNNTEAEVVEETPVVEQNNDVSAFNFDIETPVVPEVKENVEEFTFNENGFVAPIENNEIDTTPVVEEVSTIEETPIIEEVPVVSEKEIALNEIIAAVEAIKDDIKLFNDIIEKGIEVGLDQSPYLAETFENVKIYSEIVNILDKNKEEYVESVKKAA